MRYDAFISYSHGADARLAPVLQRALHRFAKPWWRARAVTVFRDETSLAAAHSLPATLARALDESAFFILMASPAAARSQWVADECEHFARHRDPTRMLIVLSEGEIAWDAAAGDFDWAKTDALPERLKGVFRAEPLYVDLRWARPLLASEAEPFNDRDPRFLAAVARLSAALRGVSLEAITGEDLRQHRKTRRVAYAAVSAIALLAAGASAGAWLATENAREAERQRAAAEKATRVAQEEEAEAKAAREKEEAERIRAQTSQSRFLAGRAQEAYARGDGALGDLLLIEALPRRTPTGPSRVEVREAVRLANERLRLAPRLIVLQGHSSNPLPPGALDKNVWWAEFSPDGRRVVTAGVDRTARVWAPETGEPQLVLIGHLHTVHAARFSPTGRYIATASADGTARLWDAANGRELAVMKPGGLVVRVAFSEDGSRMVTVSSDTRVYEVPSGREIAVMRGHTDSVNGAAFSRDGRFVATASRDRTARIWEAESGRELAILRGHDGPVFTAYFDRTGAFVVTASHDRTARIWEAKDGRQLFVLGGHEHSVQTALFDPSGQRVATASLDKTARLFDARNGREIATLRGHEDWVNDVAFSADGKRLVTASVDKTARVWDGETGRAIAVLGGHDAEVNKATFRHDRNWVVTASHDGTARLFELEPPLPSIEIQAHAREAVTAVFDRAGQRLVTSSWDNTARVWDVARRREIGVLGTHTRPVSGAEFSQDGTRILTVSHDGTARIWNAQSLKEDAVLEAGARVNRGEFSPDGRRIVLAVDDGTAQLWDVEKREKIGVFKEDARVETAAFSPNGKFVVTASYIVARVWDAESRQPIAELKGHNAGIRSARFSPDSLRVVTASNDKTARVWDALKGRELAVLRHEAQLTSATYDPEGGLIATTSYDGTVRLWDADKVQELLVLRDHEKPLVAFGQKAIGSVRFSTDGAWLATAAWDGTVRLIPHPALPDAFASAELLKFRTHRELTDAEREQHFIPTESRPRADETCDALAADPYDPANRVPARNVVLSAPKEAVDRCRKELLERPGDPRLSFLLARALIVSGRHDEARPHIEAALTAGYPMAFILEARLHQYGVGRSRDLPKAADLYRQAMDRGVAIAAYELGLMLWQAAGIDRDDVKALALWRRAAQADNAHAHAMMAAMSPITSPASINDTLSRYAIAGRLFQEAGDRVPAAQLRVTQANLSQNVDVRELLKVLDSVAAWQPSAGRGRLRE